MSVETKDWAINKAKELEDAGDLVGSQKLIDIAMMESVEDPIVELPCGGTGYFVTAEKQGKQLLM